jgi:hypothetical protein
MLNCIWISADQVCIAKVFPKPDFFSSVRQSFLLKMAPEPELLPSNHYRHFTSFIRACHA